MNLVLSTDAKPRLKWTPELHHRFIDAIIQLGGTEKATPKSLMRVMGIPGLTLYHLKSHLQKYRLGKNHPTETCSNASKQDDCTDHAGKLDPSGEITSDGTKDLHVVRAIQVQVEVHRKLYEQIEVQRHLQLRIEAQGKYLQEVLKKAQETLAAYTSSSMGVENARAELSHLVSVVSSGCPRPSLSELTEARALSLDNPGDRIKTKRHGSSTESSLTSSEDSGVKEDKKSNIIEDENASRIPLLDQPWISGLSNQDLGKKRKASTISQGKCGGGEASNSKKQATQKENVGLLGTLDLNRQYQDDQNLGKPTIDLNSIGIQQFHGASLA